MYTVVVHRRAVKYLKGISIDEKKRITDALKFLKTDPVYYPGMKKCLENGRGIIESELAINVSFIGLMKKKILFMLIILDQEGMFINNFKCRKFTLCNNTKYSTHIKLLSYAYYTG